MKAMEAMLYLFIFNLVVIIITGLGIFDITMSTGATNYVTYNVLLSGDADVGTIFYLTIEIWTSLVAGAVGGALASVLNIKVKASSAAAYVAFGGLLGVIFIKSAHLFFTISANISDQHARGAVLVIVSVFLMISGIMFIIGYIQLVRGGLLSSM